MAKHKKPKISRKIRPIKNPDIYPFEEYKRIVNSLKNLERDYFFDLSFLFSI